MESVPHCDCAQPAIKGIAGPTSKVAGQSYYKCSTPKNEGGCAFFVMESAWKKQNQQGVPRTNVIATQAWKPSQKKARIEPPQNEGDQLLRELHQKVDIIATNITTLLEMMDVVRQIVDSPSYSTQMPDPQ